MRPSDPVVAGIFVTGRKIDGRGFLRENRRLENLSLDAGHRIEYRQTPWDQRVLGYGTNEILSIRYQSRETLRDLLEQFEQTSRGTRIVFTVSRIDAGDFLLKTVMVELGYYLAEQSLKISKDDLQNYDFSQRAKLDIRLQAPSGEQDFRRIKEIARWDFHFGRLLEDPRINREKARERTALWIDDLREQGKEFLVIKRNDEILGFHIQQVQDDEADMILTGTSDKASMLALPLWAAALNDLKARGVRKARTLISAANVRMVNLYSYLDFRFEQSLLGLHRMRTE